MKRIFDITMSAVGLVLAAPMMLAIAIVIKLGSPGPVFYSCRRVGKDWKPFGMLKFRTMLENADLVDCKLCPTGDVRVTPFGQFLRRTKLNELPQLLNVLWGDMSAVGPRPEDPKFTSVYKESWDVIFSVRPGIVGPNQIANRNEDDLLASSDDPERFYIENMLPEKLERDVEYVRNRSLAKDFLILYKAVYATLFKGYSLSHLALKAPSIRLMACDTIAALAAYLAANLLRFEAIPPGSYIWHSLLIVGFTSPLIFSTMGLYNRCIRFFSVSDLLLTMRICIVSGAVLVGMSYFFLIGSGHSRAVYLIYPLILFLTLSGPRILNRILLERQELRKLPSSRQVRIIIYGAGRRGTVMLRRLRFIPDVDVVGFVDDDEELKGKLVLGKHVLGSGADLRFLKSLHNVRQVVIAFESGGPAAVLRARSHCQTAGLSELPVPEVAVSHATSDHHPEPQLVEFVKALQLDTVSLDAEKIEPFVEGASIAVVGAADAFGEQLCRELINLNIGSLILVDDCEAGLARLRDSLTSSGKNGFTCSTYLRPLGSPGQIQRDLRSHRIKWLIYGRRDRSAFTEDNHSAALACRFYDIVQFMELALYCGCEGFSLVSPFPKDCALPEEKEFQLRTERNFRQMASISESPLLCGAVRLSKILETELSSLVANCDRTAQTGSTGDTDEILHFTTAKNAARIFLNSIPMHDHKGRIFLANATIKCKSSKLLELFSEFQENGRSVANPSSAPVEKGQEFTARDFMSAQYDGPGSPPDLVILPEYGTDSAKFFAA